MAVCPGLGSKKAKGSSWGSPMSASCPYPDFLSAHESWSVPVKWGHSASSPPWSLMSSAHGLPLGAQHSSNPAASCYHNKNDMK